MFTVIIPCYNQGKFLAEAIDSALGQEDLSEPLEVFVINDGSTDETSEVAASYGNRIRYLEQENRGVSATRNRALREASHELVLFLDSDDILLSDAIASLYSVRQDQDPTPRLIAGGNVDISEGGIREREPTSGSGRVEEVSARDLVIRNRFSPTVLVDRRAALEIGGFDESLKASEDRDLWIRMATHHPVYLLDRDIILKRDHAGCLSRQAANQTSQMERVLMKAFSDPDLEIVPRDRRIAWSIFFHQSALMFSDSGDVTTALRQVFRSFLASPYTSQRDTGIPYPARLRCFASLLAKNLLRPFRP